MIYVWKGDGGGVHTVHELAHFCYVSTGDGYCGGQCGGALQYRWLRRYDNRRLSDCSGCGLAGTNISSMTWMNGIAKKVPDSVRAVTFMCLLTCVFGLESVGGAVGLGMTAAEVTAAAGPFPTVAMI